MHNHTRRRIRGSLTAVCAALLLISAIPSATAPARGGPSPVTRSAAPASPEADWASRARASISEREYEATDAGGGLQAPNRALGLRTYFDAAGARVVDRADEATELARLHTVGVGRGATMPLAAGEVTASGARVEVRRAGLVEWYENSTRGLEHGWTLAQRPDGDGPLAIDVDFGGATARADGDHATIVTADGRRLDYGTLSASDADGASLPVRMESASAGGVRIVVEDCAAVYPITVDPTLTQPAYATLMTEQASADMGYSVAGAGDVNHDGYDDVIVGAPVFDLGETDEGAAFVYLGGPAGIATSAGAILQSNQAGAELGVSVAGAGDVNGDGFDDVIVGAPIYSAGQTNEGTAYVFLGGPSGIPSGDPTTASATLQSNQTTAYFGYSVASAGYVNGDAYADVIVGAPSYDAGQQDEGAAFVFLGSASGIASGNPLTANTVLQSDQSQAELGVSVAGAGDTNGDGYGDVIVGAFDYDGFHTFDEGAAFVFYGGPPGIDSGGLASADATIRGNQTGANLGISVAGAGDVNGDGFADVIVGASAYHTNGDHAGAAFVFDGGPFGVGDGDPSVADGTVSSHQVGANMGISVAGAGDVNGDGYDDVLVGAYLYDNQQTDEGVALLVLGSRSGVPFDTVPLSASALIQSDQAGAQLGVSVAGVGDVNGDGYDDAAVGASFYDSGQTDEGVTFVYLGGRDGLSGFPLASAALDSNQSGAYMGFGVAGAGDVNDDGYDDVVVGAPRYDAGQIDEGEVYVFLGGPGGIVSGGLSRAATILQSDQTSSLFGYSVVGAGDTNGDGYDDIAVGAPHYDSGETDEGATFVFLGGPNGVASGSTSNAAAVLQSDQTGAKLGWSIAGAGDVDDDGYDDVVVGAPYYTSGQSREGAAFVFHGGPAGVGNGSPSNADAVLQADQQSANFGWGVGGGGDTNGDGYDDVLVGAFAYNAGDNVEGEAYVFFGGPTGVGNGNPSNADAVVQSNQFGAQLGMSVANAGDVNGDGYDDVLVGAPNYLVDDTTGAAFVFLGGPAGIGDRTPANADTTLRSDRTSTGFADTVAGAGDVNGDGYDDVVVGSFYGTTTTTGTSAVVFLGSVTGVANGSPHTAAAALGLFSEHNHVAVAGAGDTNGDGFDEVVVGANEAALGMRDEGAAFIYNLHQPSVAPSGSDTVGIYVPASGAWFLRNSNSAGGADVTFTYGGAGGGLVPLRGDWDGDGDDTPGLYDPATGAFFLRNANSPGAADLVFTFGAGGAGYVPVSGDWNGDGADTIGLYQPVTGTFFLRDTNGPGGADAAFSFGPAGSGWIPIAGDWDGNGTDTIGLYAPSTSTFFLKNANGPGAADLAFGFGPAGSGWKPVSGDFDGDGDDTIGLYVPTSGFFFMRNQNAPGAADVVVGYGPANVTPLVGDWDGH